MKKRMVVHLGVLSALIGIMLTTGCGKEPASEASSDPVPAALETESLPAETETEDPVGKREKFETLMRENTALWNEYNVILQEIAYYDVLQQDETAGETEYKSAREKLEETREERPLRFRPEQTFSAELETEEVIPEVPEEELPEWIEDLESQNAEIREQIEMLAPRRDALKERYGAGAME